MKEIWYLLICPEGDEANYVEKCQELINPIGLKEIICFQYHRMMRYGGKWHLEKRTALPGYIFLSGTNAMVLRQKMQRNNWMKLDVSLIPCETPYLKDMCKEGYLVGMSKGIIRKGVLIVTSGPLEGREEIIRKVDRHKRTAEIEIPFPGKRKCLTVGLEIYEKEI